MITPEIAYNLAVPTYFALTAAGAFSVAFNLAAASRRLLTTPTPSPLRARGASRPASEYGSSRSEASHLVLLSHPRPSGRRCGSGGGASIPAWSPYAAGLLGVFLVAVAGNLDGVGQMAERLSEVSAFHLGTGLPLVDSVVNSIGGLGR